jgi:hypothetical protein
VALAVWAAVRVLVARALVGQALAEQEADVNLFRA